ncbi:GNAT family N-acetyltransferase [Culicoidibacter larvae]|uniref:GNAT family N-acetyltransferase n=1 Tax=Culicoidibacter larvae TaxID=2579976 RepID=A0A5R8Q9C0_9FIRM|nr:GNAT family N-acetyltransferase [Culicoidibacter larvae]TLG72514.1 GNAT family N-acetyltransferase [Culicoidibacter larvae]
MDIVIRELAKSDYNQARLYAIDGMNLDRYAEKDYELYFYSKYFIYLELLRATQILGAYMDGKLVGVLLAEMRNENKKVKSLWYRIYIWFIKFTMNIFYKSSANIYEQVNNEMLSRYKSGNNPDGELIFFAVNPEIMGKGIGTLLLNELEKREKGKSIYLYTDSGCTYQFYDYKGFKREDEQNIIMNNHGKVINLTCFLYSKKL